MTDPSAADAAISNGAGATAAGAVAESEEGAADPSSAPPTDPGDRALLAVIDRLATILDHSDLVELEVQVGQTRLTLRKPQGLGPAAVGVGRHGGTASVAGGAAALLAGG